MSSRTNGRRESESLVSPAAAQSLIEGFANLRSELNASLGALQVATMQSPSLGEPITRHTTRPASALTRQLSTVNDHLDMGLPPPSSYPPPSAAGSHFPHSPSSHSRSLPASDNPLYHQDHYNNDLPPQMETLSEEEDPNALPGYTPRRPAAVMDVIPTKLHAYQSRSKKLQVEMTAPGEAFVVMIQGEDPEGNVYLSGDLKVLLSSPESITHIKIRLKTLIRTTVMRVHGSGRHPVNEDFQLWEDAITLYDSEAPPAEVPGNSSSDPTKLQGTLVFPFRLHLPPKVALPASRSAGGTRRIRLPPSFVLSADGTPGGKATMSSSEWASCRYFVKVTLGRKGLLKVNDRILLPLIYIPRQPEPTGSPLRAQAISEGRSPPGPLEDPHGWSGKKIRHAVKRGIFTGKKAWFEVVLLVPSPARFGRLSTIEFAIKIISSDPSVTTKFPASMVTVTLVQRAFVAAQGLNSTHDIIVGKVEPIEDGPAEGTYFTTPQTDSEGGEPAVWGKHFQGSLKLSHHVGSTFKAPNLVVQFSLAVRLNIPGVGNDTEVSVPVEIVSASRTSYPTARVDTAPLPTQPITIGASSSTVPPPQVHPVAAQGVAQTPLDRDLGLPPSYFDVINEH